MSELLEGLIIPSFIIRRRPCADAANRLHLFTIQNPDAESFSACETWSPRRRREASVNTVRGAIKSITGGV